MSRAVVRERLSRSRSSKRLIHTFLKVFKYRRLRWPTTVSSAKTLEEKRINQATRKIRTLVCYGLCSRFATLGLYVLSGFTAICLLLTLLGYLRVHTHFCSVTMDPVEDGNDVFGSVQRIALLASWPPSNSLRPRLRYSRNTVKKKAYLYANTPDISQLIFTPSCTLFPFSNFHFAFHYQTPE